MALADSMPGVSGGTIAFILGFYEELLESVNSVVSNTKDKKKSLVFLFKLLVGWVIGMVISVTFLSNMFEKEVYFLSSLFIGLTSASIVYIIINQRRLIEKKLAYLGLTLGGIVLVVLISTLRGHIASKGSFDFAQLNMLEYIYIFFTGSIAISAMVLPGISGSTLLLIFGVYIPIISSLENLIKFRFNDLTGLLAFAGGIVFGLIFSVRMIRNAFKKHRSKMIYFIIGLTMGSIYAIINGPTTLSTPRSALSLANFRPLGFIMGVCILLGLEALKMKIQRNK